MLKNLTAQSVLFAVVFAFSSTAVSQEEPVRTAVEIYDIPGPITFIQSVDSQHQHIKNFLRDFHGDDKISKLLWRSKYPEAMNRQKPVVFYDLGGSQAVQLPFNSPEAMLSQAKSKPDADRDKPFLIEKKINTGSPWFGLKKFCYGMIHNDQLIAVSKGELDGPAELDQETFNRFKNAKPLNALLDPKMLALVNRAGMGVIARPDDAAPPVYQWLNSPQLKENYTVPEKELIEKLELAFEDASFAAAGLTYAKRQLNGEFHLKFSKKDSFKGILNFENARQSNFQPTIGLSEKQLLTSISFQNSVLESPVVSRLFQKSLFPNLGFWSGIKSDSLLFRLSGGLVADSWEDIDGARVALYAPRPDALSVVTIIDAKQPDEFFAEVEKLVAIVEPIEQPGHNKRVTKEIDSLIRDLGSKKYSIRERAETRLEIAGQKAISALKKASRESESAEVRVRASRIVKRLEQRSTPTEKVENLEFWANLEPEFAIQEGTEELFGLPARRIRIQLPEKLTEQQKRDAANTLKQLFGENWNRVEVVRVGSQFVSMFGYDEALLKETIENLKAQKDPVGKLASVDAPWFIEGNAFQLHVSFQRCREVFDFKASDRFLRSLGVDLPAKDVLTSISLSLSPDYWKAMINMPVEEIKPSIQSGNFFAQ